MLNQKQPVLGPRGEPICYYTVKQTEYQTALWICLYANRMERLQDLIREASLCSVQCLTQKLTIDQRPENESQ